MEGMMSSSAQSTASTQKRATTCHASLFFLLVVVLVTLSGGLPVIAQSGCPDVAPDSSAAISLTDDIRSVRDAFASAGNTLAEPAPPEGQVPLPGAIAPRTIVKIFFATAYCLKGQTASGVVVRHGIIAADPHVLPLGSVVRLHAGSYSGIYTVMDTGGGIRGRRIDIYLPTRAAAFDFGAREVTVEVLRNGWDPDSETAEAQ
jgi:3D (Asp-Asp-Asp) domain-containing protein